ncbi:NUDIX hydrolase [Mesobacillus maritimus]|uniref:NUDIX hydrolase n=1 Tax=Mesobacillus maritimus TaxID=1643336 RepID=UPI00203F1AE5|nr:NUDIX hydrolase [Mesobacillus maritimus]MCM3671619.1 NUDIX hydrolase [Mesobacillus maritimus]
MDAVFNVNNEVFNYRVAGVLIKNNHVLLHKQVTDQHWSLPGGRVQVLEDSATGVKREMQEELGYTVEVEKLLWVTENFFTYQERTYHEIGFYYQLSNDNLNVTASPFYGEEGEQLIYQWIPLKVLNTITLYPEFLKSSLKELPTNTQHIIIK